MPYYCTVPRCTSMAGKAKNVSFHQFPRDEQLARLWNDILKRGKPYTKYSKVCSLHFKPEDYTITSVGKNKGQWRTLRKDAVPSQNLPSETPAPYSRKQWESWSHNTPNVMDQPNYQHMAHAIYMQTMLAMQAAGAQDPPSHQNSPVPERPRTSHDLEMDPISYKCTQCTKCFKDPDVFILHKRTHARDRTNGVEKENYNMNLTLKSNPILANLLKTNNEVNFDPKIVTMENLLMTALAANMDYIRNLSLPKEREDTERENEDSDLNSQDLDPTRGHCPKTVDESPESHQNGDPSLHSDQNSPKNDPRCSKDDLNHIEDPNEEHHHHQSSNQLMYEMNFATKLEGRSYRESYYTEYGEKNCENYVENSDKVIKISEKSYDTDLNESMDSNGLVIDEGV